MQNFIMHDLNIFNIRADVWNCDYVLFSGIIKYKIHPAMLTIAHIIVHFNFLKSCIQSFAVMLTDHNVFSYKPKQNIPRIQDLILVFRH